MLFQKIREDILIMKKYFVSCKSAIESRLLWQLQERQHFVENVDSFSLQDLIDVNSGELLQYLEKVQAMFIKHIKEDCRVSAGHTYFLLCLYKLLANFSLTWHWLGPFCLEVWFVLCTLQCGISMLLKVMFMFLGYLLHCILDMHCGWKWNASFWVSLCWSGNRAWFLCVTVIVICTKGSHLWSWQIQYATCSLVYKHSVVYRRWTIPYAWKRYTFTHKSKLFVMGQNKI